MLIEAEKTEYDVLNEKNIANKSILDLGCGSLGIIGIISMLRGAKTIEAVDYDSNCVCWFNKLIKDIDNKITIFMGLPPSAGNADLF